MVAMRLSEMHLALSCTTKQMISVLIEMNNAGQYVVAIDHLTDCKDMFELVTGLKGVPQDRQQRLAIMALREERMTGRVRNTLHIPTDVMLSDALTKPGTFPQLMYLLTTGIAKFHGSKKPITCKRMLHRPGVFSESDLESIQRFD